MTSKKIYIVNGKDTDEERGDFEAYDKEEFEQFISDHRDDEKDLDGISVWEFTLGKPGKLVMGDWSIKK